MTFRIFVECLEKFKPIQQIYSDRFQSEISFFESRVDEITYLEKDIEKAKNLNEAINNLYSFDINSNIYQILIEESKIRDTRFCHNFWRDFDFMIDVRLLQNQTDECAETILYLISSLYSCNKNLGEFESKKYKISTVRRFYISINDKDFDRNNIQLLINELSLDLRINPIIHSIKIADLHNDATNNGIALQSDLKEVFQFGMDEVYDLKGMDSIQLVKLSKDLQLGLSIQDMTAIQTYYNSSDKKLTRLILETISQTWSEHCKHRIFNASIDEIEEGLYKTYIKKATEEIRQEYEKKYDKPFCYSVFKDNAGAIELNEDYLITHKVETHNSPTALDPFGGSITGILGVNRDCLGFGLSAKPIINSFAFCFPNPSNEIYYYRKPNCQSPQLTANYIIKGAIKGIEVGGNCSGIPTIHGIIYFDEDYSAKPLVFCGTVGLIPKKIHEKNSWEKAPQDGDKVVIIGGRTGRDGIHGAIFSSESLNENSDISHVQIGAPIIQKKVSDAILEARDLGLFNAITDNGAGGLSSSVGEMGQNGFKVDLDRVLLKTKYMQPFEIWVSESQERMTLAVPQEKLDKFISVMIKHTVEYQVIGEFNNSGVGEISFSNSNNQTQKIEINLEFLHNGTPQYKFESEAPEYRDLSQEEIESILLNEYGARNIRSNDGITCLASYSIMTEEESKLKNPSRELRDDIISILSDINLSSREEIFTSYDHTVQGGSIVQSILDPGKVCADAGVTKPLLGQSCAIALSSAMHPWYGGQKEDCYQMAVYSVDNAIRNLIVVGANPEKIALLDNFCWSKPLDKKRLWQLKQAALGCYEAAIALGAPYISGKDSMFNDFSGFDKENNPIELSDLPTLLISSIGVVDDATICLTSDFKNPKDLIYVIGKTKPELGGSKYFKTIDYKGGFIPIVDLQESVENYQVFYKILKRGLAESSISVHLGGLITAINRSIIGGACGVNIQINDLETCRTIEQFLFSESSGRIVFSIRPENQSAVENLLNEAEVFYQNIGIVSNASENITLKFNDKQILYGLNDISSAYYKQTF